MKLDESRKFLLVFPGKNESDSVSEEIAKHLQRAEFICAENTTNAKAQIADGHPHVVVSKAAGADIDSHEIVEFLRSRKKGTRIPIILVGDIPNEEIYVDEVIAGTVHFLDDINDQTKISQCLARVLNYITHSKRESFHLKFLSPGDFLMRAGMEPQYVYIVRKGSLEASVVRDGKRIILGPVDTGEFVGEMAFINGEVRSADVAAVTDCELIEIPIEMMDKILMHKPSWSKSLMRTLSHRMKISNERIS